MTMTTIATGHQHATLIATLAVGAALVIAGTVDVGWPPNSNTPPATEAPTAGPGSFGGVTTSEELSASTTGTHAPTRSPGGATTSEEISGSTSGSLHAKTAAIVLVR
jgi:hypothetical protein